MPHTVAEKLITSHLTSGTLEPGREIAVAIDQTLTQDATGTLVMLELEAMGLERVRTEVSAQYVDHNIVQADFKNPDDHLFLRSACRRFGLWYSGPGGGVSHPVHQQRFGVPGKTLLGSDSHTCAAGALGMLAIGTGGIDVALAMAGEPFHLTMPEIWGVELTGTLPDWVSAKDVILEMLRRHGVRGGVGRIIEYHGPGLAALSAMDRHVIANMGAELGATSTVFPSDETTRAYLRAQGREDAWQPLRADADARYHVRDEIELSTLEPLIAMPPGPGNVRPVREVAGERIHQAYVGSSANPGYRDFAVVARIVDGARVPDHVSLDINPTSRQLLEALIEDGHLAALIGAGARLHQAGCNGCIGMGQAPATDTISLRTVPRNFPGRSGTREDRVCLVSPETAAASALTGRITDPRTLEMDYPRIPPLRASGAPRRCALPTAPAGVASEHGDELDDAGRPALRKGPNIASLPELGPLPGRIAVPVLLAAPDDVSTDEILPAGLEVLPYRSNVPAISRFTFSAIDPSYHERAADTGAHAVVGGHNYGQGSSREHAALAPRHLGLRLVLARSFSRIHHQNLINVGILPLVVDDGAAMPAVGDEVIVEEVHGQLEEDAVEVRIEREGRARTLRATHGLSVRQRDVLLAGGVVPWMRSRLEDEPSSASRPPGSENNDRARPRP